MPVPYFENYLGKHSFSLRINEKPSDNLGIVIVIPCFHEPDILITLSSVLTCPLPSCDVEVLVVLNYPEGSSMEMVDFHSSSCEKIQNWIHIHTTPALRFYLLEAPALTRKFAGVGWARKIGMDEAIARYSTLGKEEGVVVGFDADARVDCNYLQEIAQHFRIYPKSPGCSLYFEHPLEEITDTRYYTGILQYELHLRYLVHAIRFTSFPNAFHTVGSSFAVRASAYVKQGGMNRFKAGEDFYFLNKIIQLGGFTELNTTRVIPSPRVSFRVPFGTGASMSKWMQTDEQELPTYDFNSFPPLSKLFSALEDLYVLRDLPPDLDPGDCLMHFLHENQFDKVLPEIFRNSSTLPTFKKRFFQWFDAFQIVKYLNFTASRYMSKKPVQTEALQLLKTQAADCNNFSLDDLLMYYRKWDREGDKTQ